MNKSDYTFNDWDNVSVYYDIRDDVVCITWEYRENFNGSVEAADIKTALKFLIADVIEKTIWYGNDLLPRKHKTTEHSYNYLKKLKNKYE